MSEPRVVRSVERADPTALALLGRAGVATVHESYDRRGLMHGIGALTPGCSVAGPAVTCLNYAGDNLMVHAALELCEPGDVLVVAVTAPSAHGMFGELLATSARARGVAGVVLAAGARDVRELRAMAFPTWASGIGASGTTKDGYGWVNTPVSCGGVVVFPGDAVVGDDDGVAVVARDAAPDVARLASGRLDREAALRTRLAAGELTLDLGGYRARLERATTTQGG